jgi:hypothetical protein
MQVSLQPLWWGACAKQAQGLSTGTKHTLNQISAGDTAANDPAGDEAGWFNKDWNNNPLDLEVQVSGEGLETEHFEQYIGM